MGNKENENTLSLWVQGQDLKPNPNSQSPSTISYSLCLFSSMLVYPLFLLGRNLGWARINYFLFKMTLPLRSVLDNHINTKIEGL